MNKELRANTSQEPRAKSEELMAKIFDYINIFILLAIIAISPWPYGSVGLTSQYYIHIACLAMLLIWLIKTNIHSKTIPYYPIYTPLFLFFGITLVSIIFSIYRYASILGNLNLFSYVIIFFIISQTLNTEKRINFFVGFIILIGLFYSLYGILQFYGYLPKDFWAESNSLASRFVNSGPFAAFININIFFALGKALSFKKIFGKVTFILFLVIYIISLMLSNSRLSWLVFLITFILFLVLWQKKPTIRFKRSLVFLLIFVIIIIYLIFQYRQSLWQRIYIMAGTQFQSLHQRIDVWKGTIRIILNHPAGTGAGTFQYIYPTYRTHSDRFFIDYAHSDFLQVASELGILGLGAFIWFIVKAFKRAFKELFNIEDPKFFLRLGLICAGMAFILQSIFDFSMQIPANAILFFATIGLLLAYTRTNE